MALWSTIGDLLFGSRWSETLNEAGLVKTHAAATAFLKASNPMRTRYANRVTVVLNSLLKRAYEDSGTDMTLDDWAVVDSQESIMFKFWLLIRKYNQIILMFIRAHRERKFQLMVTILSLFFSRDHQNYARWLPIHIRVLEILPDSIQVECDQGYWTITLRNRHPYQLIMHMSKPPKE